MATDAIDHQPESSSYGSREERWPDWHDPNGRKLETDIAQETSPSRGPGPGRDPAPGLQHGRVSGPAESRPPELAVLERIPTFLQPSIPWHDRLRHFTFAWYTVTMSTSGVALVLAITPKRFTGLSEIGLAICLFDLTIFVFITVAIILRFTLHRHAFRKAFTRPSEALFVPTLFLSVAAILSNVAEYGRLFLTPFPPALSDFLEAAFWTYLAVTFVSSVAQYHILFTVKEERRLAVSAMTPAWILPIFPVMLAGTLAAACARDASAVPAARAAAVLGAGLAAQGLGLLVSVFFYATYLSRLMAFGLPVQRPGMFIAVGPPSFTCAALVAMAEQAGRVLAEMGLVDQPGDAAVLAAGVRLAAVAAAVFLWGLSFWFFASAAVAAVAGDDRADRRFHLSWWSFVFPNVGFTIASIRIGTAVGSEGVLWLSAVMTVGLVAAWAFIALRCVRAVYRREIVWPGHDEDEG